MSSEKRWWCSYCGSTYIEYCNGCPRCHLNEAGTSTSLRLVTIYVGDLEQGKEHGMSKVKQFEQHEIDAIVREEREFNDVGGCSACDVARFVATIDHWRQRAEQAEADRKVLGAWIRGQRCSMNPCGGVRNATAEVQAALGRAGS